MRSIDVRANGLRFHVREAGEGDRLVLCLHGFPQSSHLFRHHQPLLARLGYRSWAPDLRGYGRSDRPARTRDYAIEILMDDVQGLIEAAGARRATLFGHDWGGLIAWLVAMRRPALVERLVIANMPHPGPLARELRRPRQLARFWYAALFQLPFLPERMLSDDGGRRVENAILSSTTAPSRFTPDDLALYREAARDPRAVRAMLAYYRAFVRGGGARRQGRLGYPTVSAPTLLIWGEQDTALGQETTLGTAAWASDLTLRYLPDASHWVLEEQPEVVGAMLEAWLEGRPVPQAWEVA